MPYRFIIPIIILLTAVGCGNVSYKFTDASVPNNLKTFKVVYIENAARYVNPQLSPKLSDKLRQKIIGQTKLSQNNDNPNLEISGKVTEYSLTTSGIGANGTQSSNRLNVGLSITIKNLVEPDRSVDATISRNFDFPSTQSFNEYESKNVDEIVKNLVDEIFNKIFSNW